MHYYGPILWRLLTTTFSPKRFRFRHASVAVAALMAIALMAAVASILRALDHLLYPEFKRTEIESPIFILANPRSGTTFLHRLLSLDPRFDSMKLWQTLMPSVCANRLVENLQTVDHALGRPIGRLAEAFDRHLFGGWQGIHDTGLARTEEDEMLWVYPLLTPSVLLVFPFPDRLLEILQADCLAESARSRASATYRSHLQRHVHATRLAGGEGHILLGKSALAAGRIHTMRRALPDMRVIHLVRHPYEAVSSTLSMLSKPWKLHSPHLVGDTPECRGWADVAYNSYRTLHGIGKEFEKDQFVEIRYDELIKDPEASIARIYRVFGLPMSDSYRETLRREVARERNFESGHEHSLETYGLSEAAVYAKIKDVFEAYAFDP